jgi:hypothetical protein
MEAGSISYENPLLGEVPKGGVGRYPLLRSILEFFVDRATESGDNKYIASRSANLRYLSLVG